MPPKTPDELARAITLRAAGWMLSAIVTETGISASTLQRHFRKHGIERGTLSSEAVELARQQLVNDTSFIDSLKFQIASAIADDLALVRQLRESLALTLEEITGDSISDASIKSRSLAALATSLKVTQDVTRRALRMDDPATLGQTEELPQLVITRMSDDEVAELRASQTQLNDDEPQDSVSGDLSMTTE